MQHSHNIIPISQKQNHRYETNRLKKTKKGKERNLKVARHRSSTSKRSVGSTTTERPPPNVDHRRQRTTDDHHLWAPPPRTRGLGFLSTRPPPNGRHQRRPPLPKNDRRPPPVGTTATDTTEREGNCAVWVEIENEKRTRLVADCVFPLLDHHPTSTTAAKEPPTTTTYGTIVATGKGKGKEKGNCALREK
ncbi:hypothetical protein DEO72_LG6g623 [Vigna unguiculata]|uniref:Uncharacterized protein n=1 Tax=Vigna unguiculata TaxID=3917 RepID=A0A4D6M433_VIGUN|nr:hypothetical protein DEO72_LG6g623 [Vigna unguiculata]